MKEKLTPAFCLKAPLPETGDRVVYWDAAMSGFGLMVTAKGHRSFVVQYRVGKQSRRMHFKAGLGLAEARREAKAISGAVAKGGDPLGDKREAAAASTSTLKAVAEEYLNREGKRLRSIGQRRAVLERLVFPRLGTRQISDIRRSEIVGLLDRIEDENGPRMAHVVLAYLSKLFGWHASRDDDFRSPIVRGMGRINAKERARQRILSEDELRAVWHAAEASGRPFDRLVQFLLLTATRRSEAARMTRSELSGRDWLLPAARNKVKVDFLLPLSEAANCVLGKVPAIGKGRLIFTHDGERPIGAFTQFKADLQERSGTSGWTLHDLRRTARSLMTRAGVTPDHAERALGHVIPGIRGTYDRHEYGQEKAHAFEALAAQIERIINPKDNVIALQPGHLQVHV
jgi:integrase